MKKLILLLLLGLTVTVQAATNSISQNATTNDLTGALIPVSVPRAGGGYVLRNVTLDQMLSGVVTNGGTFNGTVFLAGNNYPSIDSNNQGTFATYSNWNGTFVVDVFGKIISNDLLGVGAGFYGATYLRGAGIINSNGTPVLNAAGNTLTLNNAAGVKTIIAGTSSGMSVQATDGQGNTGVLTLKTNGDFQITEGGYFVGRIMGTNLAGFSFGTNATVDLYNVILGGGTGGVKNYPGYSNTPTALPPGSNEWRYGYNTYIGGANAMDDRNTGTNTALYNVALGYSALYSVFGTGVGRDYGTPSNLPGGGNTALGLGSLYYLTNGQFNTFVGWSSGYFGQGDRNTGIGVNTLANTTPAGSYNIAVGESALHQNTSGNYNTAVGYQAGQNITTGIANVMIGAAAGDHVTTGDKNVCIGENAGDAFGGSDNLNIAIGFLAGVAGDVSVARIGNISYITDTYLYGNIHNSGPIIASNSICLSKNPVCPAPVANGGWLWNSNQALFWVTTAKTNLITDGR